MVHAGVPLIMKTKAKVTKPRSHLRHRAAARTRCCCAYSLLPRAQLTCAHVHKHNTLISICTYIIILLPLVVRIQAKVTKPHSHPRHRAAARTRCCRAHVVSPADRECLVASLAAAVIFYNRSKCQRGYVCIRVDDW